jgi:oligopeptide transport system ATP-binding protein
MNSSLPAVFKIARRGAPSERSDAPGGVRASDARIDPDAVLEIDGLRTEFPGAVVVDGVSLTVRPGGTLAVVGESGSGKSMTFLSALGLVAAPGRVTHGRVLLDGVDIARLSGEALRRLRGASISMIFQDPMTALNPVFTIGEQMTTLLRAHERISQAAARTRAAELLDRVRIPEARARLDAYPHELSGGMRQRVLIAMAVALRPKIVIADEPTTALDVTVQAQILDLLADLQQETGMAMVLITHDLGLVARYAQDVAVMYAGRVIEHGSLARVFGATRHPYAQALFRSIPGLEDEPGCALHAIEGSPPDVAALPPGCAFEPRCTLGRGREDCCTTRPPLLQTDDAAHRSACFHWRSLITTENP